MIKNIRKWCEFVQHCNEKLLLTLICASRQHINQRRDERVLFLSLVWQNSCTLNWSVSRMTQCDCAKMNAQFNGNLSIIWNNLTIKHSLSNNSRIYRDNINCQRQLFSLRLNINYEVIIVYYLVVHESILVVYLFANDLRCNFFSDFVLSVCLKVHVLYLCECRAKTQHFYSTGTIDRSIYRLNDRSIDVHVTWTTIFYPCIILFLYTHTLALSVQFIAFLFHFIFSIHLLPVLFI